MRQLLKIIAPKSFEDGLWRCNRLGKKLVAENNIHRLLDVGLGNGELTLEFSKIAKPKEVYGVEFVDDLRPVSYTHLTLPTTPYV